MHSVLSYFRAYFSPDGDAPRGNCSAGQIAQHLHAALRELGTVCYLDADAQPHGLAAELFVGHFWSFARTARANHFARNVVLYAIADPGYRARALAPLVEATGLGEPAWDAPPPYFDHDETMERADVVLLVGNSFTRETFAPRWRSKIRLLNYSIDAALFHPAADARREFCYPATHCGLRKGFHDVLETWSGIDPRVTRLHAVGQLEPAWRARLDSRNNGSIVHHGYLDSRSAPYRDLLRSCRFAYIPTVVEGQMGTALEAIFSGCVPITTRASGLDDAVLEHCIVVEPGDVDAHRDAIATMLAWSDETWRARRDALLAVAHERQSWDVFRATLLETAAGTACAR